MTIGIDTSSTSTAVVVLDSGFMDYKLFSPKDKDLRVRCFFVVGEVIRFVMQYPKDAKVMLEAPAFMATGKVIDLSMLVGAVYYGLLALGYEVILVPPTSHKKTFTGSGKASKEDMIACLPKDVLEKFQAISKKIDDLADAYSLALFTSN